MLISEIKILAYVEDEVSEDLQILYVSKHGVDDGDRIRAIMIDVKRKETHGPILIGSFLAHRASEDALEYVPGKSPEIDLHKILFDFPSDMIFELEKRFHYFDEPGYLAYN